MNIEKIQKKYLSKVETDQRTDAVLSMILSLCRPSLVIVFGSAARYELTTASDVDVVIVFPNVEDLKSAKKNLYARSGELTFPLDFILVDQQTYDSKSLIGGVLFDARHEGRVLFSKTLD
ncbi:MAG: nucleotidyltransferase domain-containing protein [Pseudomonadota bacterium]